MWHVSSRSGVATLRTAIHLLLTYLSACVTHCGDVVEAAVLHNLTPYMQVDVQVRDAVIPGSDAEILESDAVVTHTEALKARQQFICV